MSFPVQRGRVDHLFLAGLIEGVRRTAPGLQGIVEDPRFHRMFLETVNGAGIPSQPITGVKLGNMRVSADHVGLIWKLLGLDRRLPGASA